jgi:hypothetical protein
MARPDLLARAQMKCVVGNVAIDVTKKVFVRRDAKAGRPILPFDCETASRIDIGERADWGFIRFDMAVASNSHPMACSDPHQACRQKNNNRNLLHGYMISLVTML